MYNRLYINTFEALCSPKEKKERIKKTVKKGE